MPMLTPRPLPSADYRTLNFVLSSNVIVFFYSFWMIIADAMRSAGSYAPKTEPRLRPVQCSSAHAPRRARWKSTDVSRAVVPPLVLTLDFLLVFLQFGATTVHLSSQNRTEQRSAARLDCPRSQAPPRRWPACAAASPTCSW